MKDKKTKTKSYAEQYQELLKEKGYLFVNEQPVEAYSVEEEKKRYCYQDYLDWPEDERVELIDGQIFVMSAPSKRHQELKRVLCQRFSNYLHNKECEVFDAPFDVKIDFDMSKDSVVQPDILVVCDKTKFDEKGLNGAPDLVVEILSPSNRSHDLVKKYNKYREVGVQEYWIVDPDKEEIMVNLLSDDKSHYVTKTHKKGEEIKVHILDNLNINVTDLFDGYQGKEIVEVEVARNEERLETARRLVSMGLSVANVAQGSGLSIEEVEQLQTSH